MYELLQYVKATPSHTCMYICNVDDDGKTISLKMQKSLVCTRGLEANFILVVRQDMQSVCVWRGMLCSV